MDNLSMFYFKDQQDKFFPMVWRGQVASFQKYLIITITQNYQNQKTENQFGFPFLQWLGKCIDQSSIRHIRHKANIFKAEKLIEYLFPTSIDDLAKMKNPSLIAISTLCALG